ncbi:DHA14-like major facilitator [Apiospora arundinis]
MIPLKSVVVFACLVSEGLSLLGTVSKRGLDNPSPENFVRRFFATVAVLGDYVYIDGGEVSQLIDDVLDAKHSTYLVNTTLSISLSSSWCNATVDLRSVPKSAPLQNSPVTWIDDSTSSFYEWGGCTWQGPAADNLIWKFTADGGGGGAWSQVTPANIVAFNNAARSVWANFATQGRVGYALGGLINRNTMPTGNGNSATSGLVSFDFDSLKWANTSNSDMFGDYGVEAGHLESVPFGPNGLLMLLGGVAPSLANTTATRWVRWDSVSFVDPRTGTWYTQATSGTRPGTREHFCSVGVQGPNGTYEIFIYGGVMGQTWSTATADIYVLSLPGFVFFKLPNQGTPRTGHACALVGKGGKKRTPRQMLSVGGTEGFRGIVNHISSVKDPDPWKQGLGVLDLTEMVWKSQYDADADPYDTPKMVKEWYAQGGIDTVKWTNKEIKAMFVPGGNSGGTDNGFSLNNTGAAPSSSTSTLPPAMPSSGSGSSISNPGEAPNSKPNRTYAIVGGTVAGVAGIALLTTLVFLFLRRRRARQKQTPQQESVPWSKPELSSEEEIMQHQHVSAELCDSHGHSELGPWLRHEMQG